MGQFQCYSRDFTAQTPRPPKRPDRSDSQALSESDTESLQPAYDSKTVETCIHNADGGVRGDGVGTTTATTCNHGLESDIHRLHDKICSMQDVMDGLQKQLKEMSAETPSLHQSSKAADPNTAATPKPVAECESNGQEIKKPHKPSDLHVDLMRFASDAKNLDDLSWTIMRLRSANDAMLESKVKKQYHSGKRCEEGHEFDVLPEVDVRQLPCRVQPRRLSLSDGSSTSVSEEASTATSEEGSTAASNQDADSSAGSELALEDFFDARNETSLDSVLSELNEMKNRNDLCEMLVGVGANAASAHKALTRTEPCVFFHMSPGRGGSLEVLDCYVTPRRSALPLEVYDCQMTPRFDGPFELLD